MTIERYNVHGNTTVPRGTAPAARTTSSGVMALPTGAPGERGANTAQARLRPASAGSTATGGGRSWRSGRREQGCGRASGQSEHGRRGLARLTWLWTTHNVSKEDLRSTKGSEKAPSSKQ